MTGVAASLFGMTGWSPFEMTVRGDSRNYSEVGVAIADGKLGTVQYFIYIILYAEPEVSATIISGK